MTALVLPLCATPVLSQEADDDEGRLVRFLEDTLSSDGGLQFDLQGFRGALSSSAELDALTISDQEGVWLTIETVVLDWNRSAILQGAVDVTALTAERVILDRLPILEPAAESPETEPFSLPDLPVSIEIDLAEISQIDIAESVLGEVITAEFSAAISLISGSADIDLSLVRRDATEGEVQLQAAFDASTREADVNLRVFEGPGGLVSQALGVPGDPSMGVGLTGAGPLSEYTAEFSLETDGAQRLTGQVMTTTTEDTTQSFDLALSGDLTPLLTGDAVSFIGDNTDLRAQATRAPDGALSLTELSLRSGALSLDGDLNLDPTNQPVAFSLIGELNAQTGGALALPGGDATINSARFSLDYDRAQSDAVRGRGELFDLASGGVSARSVLLGIDGRLNSDSGQIQGYRGPIVVQANGLNHEDPDIAQALGERLTIASVLDWRAGDRVQVENLQLRSETAALTGDVTVTPGDNRLDLTGTAMLEAEELSIFSDLAGTALGGGLEADLDFDAELLSQAFDLTLAVTGSDLSAPQIPAGLLAGQTRLTGGLSRDTGGFTLRDLVLEGDEIQAQANGLFSTSQADLNVRAELRDLSLLDPRADGPISIAGQVTRDGEDAAYVLPDLRVETAYGTLAGAVSARPLSEGAVALDGQVDLDLPDLSRASDLADMQLGGSAAIQLQATGSYPADLGLTLDGTLQDVRAVPAIPNALLAGTTDITTEIRLNDTRITVTELEVDGQALDLSASGVYGQEASELSADLRLSNAAIFTSALSGPVSASADVMRSGAEPWQIEATADGPGGLNARVAGAYGEPANTNLDIDVQAPLALANQFIAPRSLNGALNADLTLRGAPGLDALSGRITTAGARLAAPSFNAALESLSLTADLSAGRVGLNANANLSTGGQLGVTGQIGLAQAGLPANISVTLGNARLVDPTLYEAVIARATLDLVGSLAGQSQLSGDVLLGDVEVRVPESGLGSSGAIPEITHVGESVGARQTRRFAGLISDASGSGGNSSLGLNIGVTAPGRIFIRGRGLDAELGGQLRVTGTTANPIPAGQFDLIRGRLSILGQRLELVRGRTTLVGNDPFIDFLAQTQTTDYQIFIGILGLASAPEISFISNPELPEDEVLAQLFFGRSVQSLSPVQALQLADAVAGLAGGGSGVFTRLREGLGLDNLDIQSDEEGNAALRAGRYLSDNVYTDIIIDNEDTGVTLNIDLTPSFTARGGVSAGGESSLGIYFEQDY
ncbi:MAG: translocation/assembly module TamB domain-containing protein [Pseudomonadota bacterium]